MRGEPTGQSAASEDAGHPSPGTRPAFDRDRSLQDLIESLPAQEIGDALHALCGAFELSDGNGRILLQGTPPIVDPVAVPLLWELEPVGALRASRENAPALRAAASLLQAMIASAARCAMVCDLHAEAVAADFETLQNKHVQLAESEARYRDLAVNLERRVADQVRALEKGHRQLYRAEKLASVGRLAAGVAHEINNPIGFIRSNLATAKGYVGELASISEPLRRGDAAETAERWRNADLDYVLGDFSALIAESIAGADRVSAIVADLRRAANIDRAEEGLADLNELVQSALVLACGGTPYRPEIELHLGALPQIFCRPAQIAELVLNLLRNAVAAVRNGGAITVRTRADGPCIELQLADTGEGIAPETLPRVFDPFFTTREVGQGTGLGLTVCRDIVEAHKGTIDLASELGNGTTVTVRLPAVG